MLLEVVFNLRLRGQRWVKVEAGGLVQANVMVVWMRLVAMGLVRGAVGI